jgi:hypothetical protein
MPKSDIKHSCCRKTTDNFSEKCQNLTINHGYAIISILRKSFTGEYYEYR